MGHCKKGEAEYHLNSLTLKTERFLVQLVILIRRRRTFVWHLTLSKQSQKETKMLFCYRPSDHCMAKQLMMVKKSPKSPGFTTKGWTNIVDQVNDYYTIRSKSCRWVMVALSHMSDPARVNAKTVVVFKKWFKYFKHIFIWNQLKFGKSLRSST